MRWVICLFGTLTLTLFFFFLLFCVFKIDWLRWSVKFRSNFASGICWSWFVCEFFWFVWLLFYCHIVSSVSLPSFNVFLIEHLSTLPQKQFMLFIKNWDGSFYKWFWKSIFSILLEKLSCYFSRLLLHHVWHLVHFAWLFILVIFCFFIFIIFLRTHFTFRFVFF